MEVYGFIVRMFETLWVSAPIPLRFVYAFWLVLGVVWVALYQYEKLHKHILQRKSVKLNHPYAVILPGIIALLLYNIIGLWLDEPFLAFHQIKYQALFQIGGFISLFYGLFLAVWGRISINAYWGPRIFDYQPREFRLIKIGAYGFIRHPIYAGEMAMAVGSCFVSLSFLTIVFPVGVIGLNLIRGRNENKYLASRFGEEYQDFEANTPAYIPWLKP